MLMLCQVLPRVHLFPLWGTRARESVVIFHMCRRRRHDYRTPDSPDALLWCAPCNDGDSANGLCSCDVVLVVVWTTSRRNSSRPEQAKRPNGVLMVMLIALCAAATCKDLGNGCRRGGYTKRNPHKSRGLEKGPKA